MENKENIWKRMKVFLLDAKAELKKVSWPNRDDLIKTTLAVVISSMIFGIYLAAVDTVFREIIRNFIFKWFQ